MTTALQNFQNFRSYKIVLFDAQCVLCQGWTKFLTQYDTKAQFKLASVQSPLGQNSYNILVSQ